MHPLTADARIAAVLAARGAAWALGKRPKLCRPLPPPCPLQAHPRHPAVQPRAYKGEESSSASAAAAEAQLPPPPEGEVAPAQAMSSFDDGGFEAGARLSALCLSPEGGGASSLRGCGTCSRNHWQTLQVPAGGGRRVWRLLRMRLLMRSPLERHLMCRSLKAAPSPLPGVMPQVDQAALSSEDEYMEMAGKQARVGREYESVAAPRLQPGDRGCVTTACMDAAATVPAVQQYPRSECKVASAPCGA